MIEDVNKIFFAPGDVVTIKHPLDMKPVMLVKGKETKVIRDKDGTHFLGIRCFWFTTKMEYQEQVFSTKDLIHVSNKKPVDCPDCGAPSSRKESLVVKHSPFYPEKH